MKKSKIAAIAMAAVMCTAFVSVPSDSAEKAGVAITAYAASTANAVKNVKTICSEGTLHVTWSKASGVSAYEISYKKNNAAKYTKFKTVYKSFVDIPYFSNGDEVTVKITPLKKTSSGSGYTKGKSTTFTKTFKGEAAYIKDGFFGFDTSLLNQSKSKVQKALGVKFTLEDWEWWKDDNGDSLKVGYAYLENYDATIALLFDEDNKLYEAYYDLPTTDYTDEFNILVANYYGKPTKYTEGIKDGYAFYDMYTGPNSRYYNYSDSDYYYYYNVYEEIYAIGSEVVMRQMYFYGE